MLELKNVSKNYFEGNTKHSVLSNFELSISKGEIIILLGKSGSGKSTLLNIISGIDVPDGGSVSIDGTDITKLSEKERTLTRRNKIGFIFQFFNLIPTLTVKENLQLPLELNNDDNQEERIKSILTEVGLLDRANTYPDKLSGGEQQRIAIARALIHNPDIILADEPTGNLDPGLSEEILNVLKTINQEHQTTVVMVTHSPLAAEYGKTKIRLQNGKLNSFDSTRNLIHEKILTN